MGKENNYTAWASSTNANRAVGQLNLANLSGNYFAFTGVQLETGTVATPYEWMDYGTELAKCQRYYQLFGKTTNSVAPIIPSASAIGATEVFALLQFTVQMRTSPSVSQTGTLYFRSGNQSVNLPSANLAVVNTNTTGAMFNYNSLAVTSGDGGYVRDNAGTGTSNISISAEL